MDALSVQWPWGFPLCLSAYSPSAPGGLAHQSVQGDCVVVSSVLVPPELAPLSVGASFLGTLAGSEVAVSPSRGSAVRIPPDAMGGVAIAQSRLISQGFSDPVVESKWMLLDPPL